MPLDSATPPARLKAENDHPILHTNSGPTPAPAQQARPNRAQPRPNPQPPARLPDKWRLRAAIMKALQDFPAAREAVVQALRAIQPEEPE
jgi:hypothetical protein